VTVGTTGPMGSGLPQFGFPRRFAIGVYLSFGAGCSGHADRLPATPYITRV
jgi:hypothetical protein